jgi:mRNA-degrading endonuclease toxin of MazEF toxin-antitoxin module
VNRGEVYSHQGLGRSGHVVIVSNDPFNAVTGQPLVVRISDRPDLAPGPYVIAMTGADPVLGHAEAYSVLRVRRDRLGDKPAGCMSAPTMRELAGALALLLDL